MSKRVYSDDGGHVMDSTWVRVILRRPTLLRSACAVILPAADAARLVARGRAAWCRPDDARCERRGVLLLLDTLFETGDELEIAAIGAEELTASGEAIRLDAR